MEQVSVTVTIMGRKYKLRISEAEEPYLTKAAEMIENQAKSYGKMYAYQDHQDLLAMVALTQITQLAKLQEGGQTDTTAIAERLTAVNDLLSKAID